MELRRIHSPAVVGADNKPIVVGVDLFHTGAEPAQTFRRGMVLEAVAAGWMRLQGDTLTLIAQQDTLTYTVNRHPGYYVKSTGERIPLSDLAMGQFLTETVATLAPAEARAFLAGKGLDPTDYEATRNYHCTLDTEQHAKWQAVRNIAGNLVAAHTLEG